MKTYRAGGEPRLLLDMLKLPAMASIQAFKPYRYSPQAGAIQDLVTQPYDKISPKMQQDYLERSPHNLVRVILGPRTDNDTDSDNVYTRAAQYFEDWIASGILRQETVPGVYLYSQEFTVPDSTDVLVRTGFIALGAVEPYEAGIVHRHEQTLSGPKKDRRLVLEHTRAHFGQIFILFPDPERAVDSLLSGAAAEPPITLTDEYGVIHTLSKVSDHATIAKLQQLMADKKLVIADGHHRYETALAFHADHPELEGAKWVMMTFVNMHSEGLRILATHRVLKGLKKFDVESFLKDAAGAFAVRKLGGIAELKQMLANPAPDRVRIGVVAAGSPEAYLLERARNSDLDVRVLHDDILQGLLAISQEDVRDEHYIKYVRGIDSAADLVVSGQAQVAFLLEPTTVQQVADTSFGGGCMPQKSTDFYPKLLTGLTIYRLEH